MSIQLQLRRFQLILDKLENSNFPTIEDILETLANHDIFTAERTVQRDLKSMRDEFGIAIKYDRQERGYYIDKNDMLVEDFEFFQHFLGLVKTADILVESLAKGNEYFKYVTFGSSDNFSGLENLKGLLGSIKEQKIISFDHYNYQKHKTKNYVVYPYSLYEFRNRWYLRAIPEGATNFLTFGLDRIKNLQLNLGSFERDDKKDPNEIFRNMIGVWEEKEPLQEIILSFLPWRGNYLKSLKIHKSQEILIESDQEFRIKLLLKPNNELIDQILMYGDSVKVIEPEWLVNRIKSMLTNSLNRYH